MTSAAPVPSPAEEVVARAVTALFVPGDRPDRYAKAVASGADVVIIDLEDAVAPPDKDRARQSVVEALTGGGLRTLVRINDPRSVLGRADLAALAALVGTGEHGLLGVLVPKAGEPAELTAVTAALGSGVALVALVESARGVAAANELARTPGLTRLAFGALDFALDAGSAVDALTGQVARAQLVIACRAAGLPGPLESPATELRDPERVEATSRAAAVMGFTGRLCIHPAQLEPVRAGFAPTADEVAWAERIVASAGDAAVRVDDQMVDRPVLERARGILTRAR